MATPSQTHGYGRNGVSRSNRLEYIKVGFCFPFATSHSSSRHRPESPVANYIHDVGFGDFARNSAPWWLKTLRENGIDKGIVVDLGCGTGVWASELSRAGYDLLGIDLSPSMIAIARKRAPKAKVRVGSLLEGKLPRCDAVTSLGECLNYLFDETNSLAQVRSLFRRVIRL